jgi:hypothetical protein
MTILDDPRFWRAGALSGRHIAVAVSEAGLVDPQNPLIAASAAGPPAHIYIPSK